MLRSVLIVGLSASVLFAVDDKVEQRLRDSADVFKEIMSTPDKAIPMKLLNRAQCVMIVPGMKKAALGVGGEYGRGFVSCVQPNGEWGPPAGIRLSGGSFGLQLGAQATDVVMLVMNQRGLDRLLSDKFTIGGEASAAVGPLGRDASADTDIALRAEILSWSRSRGVFAGVSLDGTVIQGDSSTNRELYGMPLTTKEIVHEGVPTPPAARVLTSTLNQYAARNSSASIDRH
jgi:lipid-binding SYLF domain-containing protein